MLLSLEFDTANVYTHLSQTAITIGGLVHTRLIYIATIAAALIVPAVAIHIGGFLAYLATVAAFIGAWWQVRITTIRAIRVALGDPQPHQEAREPYASAQD